MRARKGNPPQVRRPWWVSFALLGLPNRVSALACLGLLMWVAALSVILGYRDARDWLGVLARYVSHQQLQTFLWSVGVLASLFSLWYLRAIVWVDRNGGWPGKPSPPAKAATSGEPAEPPKDEPPPEAVS